MSIENILKSVDDFLKGVLNIDNKNKKQNYKLSKSQEKILEENFDGKWHNPIKTTYYNSGDYQKGDKYHGGIHNGVDLRAPGGTSVYPIAIGYVEKVATWDKGGNIVTILHPKGVRCYMAHLGTIVVKPGDFVNPNVPIASVGSSGNAKNTIPHIHMEIRVNGSLTNPNKFIYVPPYTNFDSSKEQAWLSNEHKQKASNFKVV